MQTLLGHRQARAISIDPDQTSAEYHLYSNYLDRQAGAISVDSDQTPAEYHLYSKYLDRQAGAMSIDPDLTPAGYHLYSKYLDRQAWGYMRRPCLRLRLSFRTGRHHLTDPDQTATGYDIYIL